MPIHSCTLPSGGKGYKWGGSGHCYPERSGAERQAAAAHANGFHGDAYPDEPLAFDRDTVRSVDRDGRMHISVTPISKACVNGYYGWEIPNSDRLGLVQDKLYMLLRDPEELKRAANTFNNLPLLDRHTQTTADDPQKQFTVGTTGSEAKFDDPYLTNSLAVWDAAAIMGVLNMEQCELSSSYHYEAIMEPGEYEGERFDGRMTNIVGNHVALVTKGRAGPDVAVGDEAPSTFKEFQMAKIANTMTRKAIFASGAVSAYLAPKLAKDQAIDLNPVFVGVNAKTFAAKKASVLGAIRAAVEGKLAKDADVADLAALLDAVGTTDVAEADPVTGDNEDLSFLEGKISPEDMQRLCEMMQAKAGVVGDETDAEKKEDEREEKDDKKAPPFVAKDMVSKTAMDAALKDVEAKTIARMNRVRKAEQDVAPFVGKLTAMDSAEAVYKLALDAAKVDLTGVPPEAFEAMVRMLPKPSDKRSTAAPVAMDSSSVESFAKRYPNAAKIGTV